MTGAEIFSRRFQVTSVVPVVDNPRNNLSLSRRSDIGIIDQCQVVKAVLRGFRFHHVYSFLADIKNIGNCIGRERELTPNRYINIGVGINPGQIFTLCKKKVDERNLLYYLSFHKHDGGMAELVDALDSKSCGLRPCQFKSDYPYHFEKPWYFVKVFCFCCRFILTFTRIYPHVRIKYLAYIVRMKNQNI